MNGQPHQFRINRSHGRACNLLVLRTWNARARQDFPPQLIIQLLYACGRYIYIYTYTDLYMHTYIHMNRACRWKLVSNVHASRIHHHIPCLYAHTFALLWRTERTPTVCLFVFVYVSGQRGAFYNRISYIGGGNGVDEGPARWLELGSATERPIF